MILWRRRKKKEKTTPESIAEDLRRRKKAFIIVYLDQHSHPIVVYGVGKLKGIKRKYVRDAAYSIASILNTSLPVNLRRAEAVTKLITGQLAKAINAKPRIRVLNDLRTVVVEI